MPTKANMKFYMKTYKVSELFEEMMGKLVTELPDNPVEYLLKFLQKKYSASSKAKATEKMSPRPSSAVASIRSPSPKSPEDAKLKVFQNEASEEDKEGRQYEKPWLVNSKKSPLKQRPLSASGSFKRSWDSRSMTSSKASGVSNAEEVTGAETKSVKQGTDLRNIYTTPKIVGKPLVSQLNDEDEELKCADLEPQENTDKSESNTATKKLSAAEAKKLRQQKMKALLEASNKQDVTTTNNTDNRKNNDDDSDVEDDAMELCENINDLLDEGVENATSKGVYKPKETVSKRNDFALVLNMSRFFDSVGGSLQKVADDKNSQQGNGGEVDDDDFESASQVTGPRKVVWEVPPSESSISPQTGRKKNNRLGNSTIFDDLLVILLVMNFIQER